ncbi:CHAT domain-containing tetratricopeptide repeat protein [Fulvivirga kasyanovii]
MGKISLLLLCLFVNSAFAIQNSASYPALKKMDSLVSETSYKKAYDVVLELLQKASKNDAFYHLIQSKLFYCKGLLEEKKGEYGQAIDLYQKAQDALSHHKNSAEATYKVTLFSRQYHALAYSGDWQAALEKGTEGLVFMNATVDKKVHTDYIYDLGYINDRLSNYIEAINLYQQSIVLYKTFEEEKNADLGLAYNNLATVYNKIGFFSERLKSLEKARFYWEKDNTTNPSWLISLYGNMMKLYIEYGDATKAKQLFTALNKVSNEGLQISNVFNKFRLNVMYYVFSNQSAKAESELVKYSALFSTLSQKEKEQNIHFYLAALLEMADYYFQEELDHQALETATRAVNLAKTFQQSYYEMLAYTKQTKLATAKKEYVTAIDLLDKALAINDQQPIGLVNVVNILIKKGNLQAKQNRITEARETIIKALSVLAEKEITSPEDITITTFEQQHSSYFVMALKNSATFYEYMYNQTHKKEDAKNAKYLYEMAAEVFGLYYQNGEYNTNLNSFNKEINEGVYEMHSVLKQPLAPEILAIIEANNSQVLRNEFERKHFQFLSTEDSLLAQRNLLQFQLKNSEKDSQKELKKAIEEIDSAIAIKDPLMQSFYNERINLQNIQSHLTKDELLVEYAVGNQRVFAIVISKNNIQLFRLGETDSLEAQLTSFYKKLQNPQKNTLSQAKQLYKQLMEPFQIELKDYKTLTIIPDDFLHYLPFEVLENESNPLVNTHDIQYANSVALWYFLKKNVHQPKQHQDLLAAFAPQYDPKTDGITSRGNRFKDIKAAKIEAEKISATFNGDLFLNREASVENFINHASAYKIYHLAMHAVLNEEEHTQSSLVFHNNDYFNFSALYSMYFPADLVVLSACNTGVGKLAAGEGFLSLSRALTYSGVRSSVYSLWEVPDQETSEIMVSFYHYLSEGENKATALTNAKKDFIEKNPLKSHPYYWAGFVVNGDTTPSITPTSHLSWYIFAGIIFIAAVLINKRYRRTKSV